MLDILQKLPYTLFIFTKNEESGENPLKKRTIATMAADDPRQNMLNEDFEIYEKIGVPSGAMEIHFHNFYEIMYIAEGEFAILLDNTTYILKSGDIMLIDVNKLHHYQYSECKHDHNKRIILWISKAYLNRLSGNNADLSACFSIIDTPAFHFPAHYRERFQSYLTELLYIYAENEKQGESLLLSSSYLTLFFVYLNRLCLRKEFYFSQQKTYRDSVIHTISQYITDHIQENITVDTLADQVHLSKYYLIRMFKSATGMTVHAFITQKRLITACELIWNGVPLSEIYIQCGFQNYSSFFRNFKTVYGISPQEYKMHYEENES